MFALAVVLTMLRPTSGISLTSDDHPCSVLGVNVEEVVRNVCFSASVTDGKHATPSMLRWTLPVCATNKTGCTNETDSIERDDVSIGRYDGQWQLVRSDGETALAVNFSRGASTSATVLLKCDPDAWATALSVTLHTSSASSRLLYRITIAHFSLCDKLSLSGEAISVEHI